MAAFRFQKFPTPPWKFYATDLVKWIVKKIVRHPDQAAQLSRLGVADPAGPFRLLESPENWAGTRLRPG